MNGKRSSSLLSSTMNTLIQLQDLSQESEP